MDFAGFVVVRPIRGNYLGCRGVINFGDEGDRFGRAGREELFQSDTTTRGSGMQSEQIAGQSEVSIRGQRDYTFLHLPI